MVDMKFAGKTAVIALLIIAGMQLYDTDFLFSRFFLVVGVILAVLFIGSEVWCKCMKTNEEVKAARYARLPRVPAKK